MGTNGFASGWRDLAAVSAVVVRYYVSIAPVVRGELGAWRERAVRIPDPMLRAAAVDNLDSEHLHVHAAAVFATLAPRRHRRPLVRLLVAFEVMYDYLDTLSEQPSPAWVANGLQLHQALAAAVSVEGETDFYALHDRREDGGYLAELAVACRERFDSLPARREVLPVVERALARCAEGQTRAHAAVADRDQLRECGRRLAASDPGLRWWELTAATASSLVVHALLAAAATPATTRRDALAVEAAYYPALSALTTLLDSLVDHDDDRRSGEHSYVGYYASSADAAARLATIAAAGLAAVERLPRRQVIAALRPALIHPILLAVTVKRVVAAAAAGRGGRRRPARARCCGGVLGAAVRRVGGRGRGGGRAGRS